MNLVNMFNYSLMTKKRWLFYPYLNIINFPM